MAKGILIDGEKLAAVWRETLLPQEVFAEKIGMRRSGVFRLTRPGVRGMHSQNFKALADLRVTPGTDPAQREAVLLAVRKAIEGELGRRAGE